VPDEHRVAIAIEGLVQGDRVGDQRANPVAGVVGDRGGRVAAHKRRHRVEPGLGQPGQQVPPGVGAVRKAVQAQRQRAGPGLQQPERKPVRLNQASPDHHGATLPPRTIT
jgi:hypothetical protein